MGREARTALQSIDGEYRSPQRHLPLVVACCLCRCEPVGALHCFEDTGRDPGEYQLSAAPPLLAKLRTRLRSTD